MRLLVARTCGFGSANLCKLGSYPANEADSSASTIVKLVLASPRGLRPALASVGSEQQRTPLSGGLPGWRIASPRTQIVVSLYDAGPQTRVGRPHLYTDPSRGRRIDPAGAICLADFTHIPDGLNAVAAATHSRKNSVSTCSQALHGCWGILLLPM